MQAVIGELQQQRSPDSFAVFGPSMALVSHAPLFGKAFIMKYKVLSLSLKGDIIQLDYLFLGEWLPWQTI